MHIIGARPEPGETIEDIITDQEPVFEENEEESTEKNKGNHELEEIDGGDDKKYPRGFRGKYDPNFAKTEHCPDGKKVKLIRESERIAVRQKKDFNDQGGETIYSTKGQDKIVA